MDYILPRVSLWQCVLPEIFQGAKTGDRVVVPNDFMKKVVLGFIKLKGITGIEVVTEEPDNVLRNWDGYDYTSAMIAWENGKLSDEDTVIMFQFLVDTGEAWNLQGFYGRTAEEMMDEGLVASEVDELPQNALGN